MSTEQAPHSSLWQDLKSMGKAQASRPITDLFEGDHERLSKFSAEIPGLYLDFSKTNIGNQTLSKLIELANAQNLEDWREKMFSGEPINNTENRAVLHTALRGSTAPDLFVDGENISDFVSTQLQTIERIAAQIRKNPNITDVINIGIGGSDLGPKLVVSALQTFADGPRVHFVSNVDGADIDRTLKTLKAENTAIIVVSKTFTTTETMMNAHSAKDWLAQSLSPDDLPGHLFAVSTNADAIKAFGVPDDQVLPMRDWTGGRYSLWSSVGLSIAVALGFEKFTELLSGARALDEHFKTAPLEKNLPVLLALCGIWHRNFCAYDSIATLPYAQDLDLLPSFLQQLDMESNGKSIDRDKKPVTYDTGPIIFGGTGTNAQHAFFQLLHQGTTIIPCEFIGVKTPEHKRTVHHKQLLANMIAQSEALLQGRDRPDDLPRHFSGERPSITLLLERLDPYHLGMLLALYEHKVFVQGIIWNLNSFDQWGVELGKEMAKDINALGTPSPSTTALLERIS